MDNNGMHLVAQNCTFKSVNFTCIIYHNKEHEIGPALCLTSGHHADVTDKGTSPLCDCQNRPTPSSDGTFRCYISSWLEHLRPGVCPEQETPLVLCAPKACFDPTVLDTCHLVLCLH